MTSTETPTRLLIAAGGTGGHIYPGLAIAREFQQRQHDAEIAFCGTQRGLEGKLVGAAGFDVIMLRAAPLRGGSPLRKLKGVLALLPSLLDAHRLLRRRRPDAVVGIGGYAAGPVLLVAALRRIPTLILEPNFEPGLTNRGLARFVDAAAVAWEETARHFGDRAVVTGNPVRPEIETVPDAADSTGLRVLLFGGSQGSRALNEAMLAALPALGHLWRGDSTGPPGGADLQITHQTGPRDLERIRERYAALGVAARVEAYLSHMDREYARCDIVVSRSGATTCAELAAAGRGAILVPLELAGGHQKHNAEALQRAGAAVVIDEADLSGESLARQLGVLAEDPSRCRAMGRKARAAAKPEAAKRIVDRLLELLG